ncbi:MAG: PorP/SprF family type IX secretion system membrane protein [Flavobacteriales bacterium]|nr:type IX secretion system membrane protein PorP/SprF [Flavobacteriia bacterium]
MKKFILYFALLVMCNVSLAQQLPQFTSYQLSPFLYNPAFAGVDGTTQLNAVIRNQWSGVREAPQTDVISGYGLLRNEKMGLGATAFKDVAGADSRRGITLSYAYHLRVKNDMSLSLGLSAGFLQYRLDHTIINPYDDGDPVFNSPVLSSVVPTATFGAYLYADNFYASVALPQLLSSTFTVKDEYNDNSLIEGGLTNHIFVGGGYIKDINDAFTIEPSLLLMLSSPAPASVELMTKLTYKDLLWTALSYRFNDAACMYIGVDIDERFYVAYAHDFVTSELSTVTSGTNEFKLGFRFNKAK